MSPKPLFTLSKAGSQKLLGFTDCPVTVHFAYTNDSSNLESMTAIGGVWDESGQKDNLKESHEAYDRRLSLARSMTFGLILDWLKEQKLTREFGWWIKEFYEVEGPDATFGRRLWGTTPYEWNWFKTDVYDKAEKREHGFELFNFKTWMNPLQSEAECRKRLDEGMPLWRWLMMYCGEFTRPAGLIYDCFDFEANTCEDFKIPRHWKVYPGVDFGPFNFAGGWIAEDPDSKTLYVIGEHHAGQNLTVAENVRRIKACPSIESKVRFRDGETEGEFYGISPGAGGSHGEEGWRDACRQHGLPIDEPPVNDVEVQIQCVYSAFAAGSLKIFRSCRGVIEQIHSYSRELDALGNVTEKIANKSVYHHLDWVRYLVSKLRPPKRTITANPMIPSLRLAGVSRNR